MAKSRVRALPALPRAVVAGEDEKASRSCAKVKITYGLAACSGRELPRGSSKAALVLCTHARLLAGRLPRPSFFLHMNTDTNTTMERTDRGRFRKHLDHAE